MSNKTKLLLKLADAVIDLLFKRPVVLNEYEELFELRENIRNEVKDE